MKGFQIVVFYGTLLLGKRSSTNIVKGLASQGACFALKQQTISAYYLPALYMGNIHIIT